MLIYWQHVYSDELYDAMNYSCPEGQLCENLRLSNFTSEYVVSTGDHVANYVAGVMLVLSFLISTLLNPVVFLHFYKEASSMVIVDLLFRILAISDFLTNLYPPLFYAHQIFHPQIQASVKRTWGYMVAQSISCNVGCISQSATTLLAVARYIRLKWPFVNINKVLFLGLFLLYALGMTGITYAGKYYFYVADAGSVRDDIMTILKDFCFYLNLVQCVVGVVFSVMCVAALFEARPDKNDQIAMKTYELRKKGCVTIMLINLPYLVSLCFALCAAITQYKHLQALMFTFLPVLTSALNPTILCTRNTGIRKRLREVWRWVVRRVCASYASTDQYTMIDDKNMKTMASEI